MACCTGEKIPWEEINAPELKTLRNNLVNYVGGNVGLGAKPYTGEIAAPVNDSVIDALNLVRGMTRGGVYSPQSGIPYSGGQQGSPMPWVPYPGGSGGGGGDDGSNSWQNNDDIIGKDELQDPSKTSRVRKDQLTNPNAWFDRYDQTTW